MKADRFNEGKPQWHQLHFKSLLPLIRVMEYGEKKYGKDNWRKGQDIPSLCDCAMRHLTAFMDGEELDPESGVSHIGHIMANCMMIVYNSNKDTEGKPFVMRYRYEEPTLVWYDIPLNSKTEYVNIYESIAKIKLQADQVIVPFEQWLKETYNIEK